MQKLQILILVIKTRVEEGLIRYSLRRDRQPVKTNYLPKDEKFEEQTTNEVRSKGEFKTESHWWTDLEDRSVDQRKNEPVIRPHTFIFTNCDEHEDA